MFGNTGEQNVQMYTVGPYWMIHNSFSIQTEQLAAATYKAKQADFTIHLKALR